VQPGGEPAAEDSAAKPGGAEEAAASAGAGPGSELGEAAPADAAADGASSATQAGAPQLAKAEPVTSESIESTGSAAPSTAPGERARRAGGRKADKPGAAGTARERGGAQLAKVPRAGAKPFSPRPPSAGAAGAPIPGAAEAAPEPFAESMEDDAEAAVATESDGDADKLEMLGSPPSGAPEVSLLFIQWSRVPEKRVASLRSAGGRLVVVHEGDLVEGMRVATIHPDAIEFVWRGSQFQVIAARY
jgi:hypothetical protein